MIKKEKIAHYSRIFGLLILINMISCNTKTQVLTQHQRAACPQVAFFFMGLGAKYLFSYLVKSALSDPTFRKEIKPYVPELPEWLEGSEALDNVSRGIASGLTGGLRVYLVTSLEARGLNRQAVNILSDAFTAGSSVHFLKAAAEYATDSVFNRILPLFYETVVLGKTLALGPSTATSDALLPTVPPFGVIKPGHATMLACGSDNPHCFTRKEQEMLLDCSQDFAAKTLRLLIEGTAIPLGFVFSILAFDVGNMLAESVSAHGIVASKIGPVATEFVSKGLHRWGELTIVTNLQKLLLQVLRQASNVQSTPLFGPSANMTLLQTEKELQKSLIAASLSRVAYVALLPKEIAFLQRLLGSEASAFLPHMT